MSTMPTIYVTHSLPWRMHLLRDDGPVYFPNRTRCPECGGTLLVDVTEWESETGRPTECGVEIDCQHNNYGDEEEDGFDHRWWQSDWMPVLDALSAWARRHLRKVWLEDD